MKHDFLSVLDLDKETLEALLDRARVLKKRHAQGIVDRPLMGKTLGLIFDKASTRTRISFEAAMAQLGGTPIFISARDTQISRDEPVQDTARVLARFLDCLAIRTYSQKLVEEFAFHASIPVINALTDRYHPCQIMSDLLTVLECKGDCRNVNIAWVGDGNNVAHSWINAARILGFSLTLACPDGYHPDPAVLGPAVERRGDRIRVMADPKAAVRGADVIYTDVWASMGQEKEQAEREAAFKGYLVDDDLVACADPKVVVMHCLPAHREEEISEAVLEGSHSVVWDQAENKLHMHKALLEWAMLNPPA
ncbi:MAG: ornithine carbamoyltransferase [Deltaproteobacteria bacterium]|nr:MAG: ornithine carbamoyltransferase [Deltaproteobacteria bacterium]